MNALLLGTIVEEIASICSLEYQQSILQDDVADTLFFTKVSHSNQDRACPNIQYSLR